MNRSFLYRCWAKALTVFGNIGCSFSPPAIRAKDIRECLWMIQAGDLVFRRYVWYLDGYLIPGEWTHSGLYTGNQRIVHAIAAGVLSDDIIDFIKDADGFLILRPSYPEGADRAIMLAEVNIGMPYDFLFDKTTKDALYCHELPWYALAAAGIEIVPANYWIDSDDLLPCGKVVLEC
jgi:uncharacterized protein YycO